MDNYKLYNHIKEMQDAEQNGHILLIEIINLPIITAIYESRVIDQILFGLSSQIKAILGDDIYIERTGKEYFTIITQLTDKELIEKKVKELHKSLLFFNLNNDTSPIHLLISVGCSEINSDIRREPADIYDHAYVALKNLNQLSNKFYFPYNEISIQKQKFKNDMILATTLKKAILDRRLRLAYQPIIDSRTGEIEYHESLLRLIKEDGQVISIGPFIAVAEQMGLINAIDEIVLEMVAEELKRSPNITLAFNVSGLGIDNENLLVQAKELLQDQGLASRAIVELTETAAQKNLGKSAFFVASLQEIGCKVALDDFGSGHTSFRQLKALPVDIIKIDGAFIKDIVSSADNRLFVKTLLNISRGFGLKSVAEYVENGEIAKLLMELKVDYLQGNYFCPAVNYRSWETK